MKAPSPLPLFEIQRMNSYFGLGFFMGVERLPWRNRFVLRIYWGWNSYVFSPYGKLKEGVPPYYDGSGNQTNKG